MDYPGQSIKRKFGIAIMGALVVSVAVAIATLAATGQMSGAVLYSVLLAVLALYAYEYLTAFLYFRLWKDKQPNIARFYMVHQLVKLLISGAIAAIGSMALGKPANKMYLILFTFAFLTSLIAESYAFVQTEKKMNNETIH